MPLIRFSNVTLVRGLRVLVQDVSFSIERGEIWQLEGANGSGKTSFLRAAAGLLKPYSGDVFRDDSALISFLGHELAIKPFHKVRDYLSNTQVNNWELAQFVDTPAKYLSAGQKKRLALAARCRSDADLWLFDEPLANLDQRQEARLAEEIANHASRGGAVLCSVHTGSVGGRRVRLEGGSVRYD